MIRGQAGILARQQAVANASQDAATACNAMLWQGAAASGNHFNDAPQTQCDDNRQTVKL